MNAMGPAGFPCVGMERTTRFLCEAQLLNVLADGLPGIVAYIDKARLCRFVNGVVEAWLGKKALQCLGLKLEEVFDGFSDALAPEFDRALSGAHVEFEAPAPFSGGLVNVVRGFIYPDRDLTGVVQGAFILLLDITRERAFERELKIARDEAIEANRSKSRFLAAASHDLRQPLQAITLFVSALGRRVKDAEPRALVDNISASLGSLRRMIDALLDMSKLESGLIQPERSVFRLQELFDALAPEFAAQAREKKLGIKILPSAALVEADRALLETSLRNLVANAFKFTERGRILIGARHAKGRVGIVVADSGVGIANDRLVDIFQEFQRAKSTPRGANDGIGLGLAIVKRLVALHGGEVSVRSRPGRGAIFTIWLGAPNHTPRTARMRALAQDRTSIADRRVLVLEDDLSCADALKREFEDHGAIVTAATSIDEAERKIRATGAPEAMIVDYNLGGDVNGLQFVKRMARRDAGPRAVMVTGSTDAETLSALRASGIPWLTKPVDPQILRQAVLNVLNA